jgi:hypothetical protein
MKFVATFPLETAASAAILDSSSQRKGCDAPFAAVSCAQPLPDNSTRSDDRHLGLGTRLFLLEVLDFNCELRRIIQLASGVRKRPCGRIVLPARIDEHGMRPTDTELEIVGSKVRVHFKWLPECAEKTGVPFE